MSEKRIQFSNIVQNQLPNYVKNDFPLISEFLKQYYIAQEYQGAPIDLIQNIDKYVKLDNITNLSYSTKLASRIDFDDTVIIVDATDSYTGTNQFPDSYGLLKIGDEIITYTGKTDFSFTGCIRGFSGIESYRGEINPEELIFKSTEASSHESGTDIINLSCLFLKEFLSKTKIQLIPGLENRKFAENLNENIFIKNAKDFYLSRGTDRGFEILFKALYNEDVKIVRPSEFLITPSNAHYKVTDNLIVEPIDGNPNDLKNRTLYQGNYGNNINYAYAPITDVEEVRVGIGETYYILKLDAGYNRDVGVRGAIYGEFSIYPKTQVIDRVSSGSSCITVDSTVGFDCPGELYLTYDNGSIGIVSYTSKSLNQFFNCTNISGTILDKSIVGINTFAYAAFDDQEVRVRINSVLGGINFSDDSRYYEKEDVSQIKTLGESVDNSLTKNWFYNVSPTYKVDDITLVDSSDNTYRVNLNVDHFLKLGDVGTITSNDGISRSSTIIDIPSSKSIVIKGQGNLSSIKKYTFKRNLLRLSSNFFPESSFYTTNIQNVYRSKIDKNEYIIASPSIPSYESQPIETSDRSITFSGRFIGEDLEISPGIDHGFYTGDAVYYIPEKIVNTTTDDDGQEVANTAISSTLFIEDSDSGGEGLYFIKRVSSTTIKLSRSRTNIYESKFISVDSPIVVKNNIIKPFELKSKSLESQKLFRKILKPISDGSVFKTNPGFTGILINGVEILNYKSNDFINYGKIEMVDILSPGFDYDIVSPPPVIIEDPVGVGAEGFVSLSGSLVEIKILDPGFDYEETPKVSITGGNGIGAKAFANMSLIDHSAPFNSQSQVGIGTTLSIIGFSTYHKFRNSEKIIYITNDQNSIGGLVPNESYFVSIQDSLSVKLHKNLADSISGINTVSLLSSGVGVHELRSFNKKLVVESINVVSSGFNYQNKKRSIGSVGINTSLNTINIKNHDYNTGEVIKYNCEGSSIGGLSNETEYYLTKVDENSFKLSKINTELKSEGIDYFYKTAQYENLTNSGVGTHIFNYQDISVRLVGKVGISSIGNETFEAKIEPIFRGEVTSLYISNGGVGYGSSEVINFERPPKIKLGSGYGAQISPVIRNGSIVQVIVLSSGKNYTHSPDLNIVGSGVGAVLVPIIVDGQLSSVKINSGGFGYGQETYINVISSGQGASFRATLQSWRVNLFEKNFSRISNDDGYITKGINENFGLQYSHIYAPRKLRESIFSVDQDGKILYGKKDLKRVNSLEVKSKDHSPIIGWAYDGNPIYGPYGFAKKSGGAVLQMKSGYRIDLKESRPPISIFPEGFFVEDYLYLYVGNEDVLDENNGRFCITPDFPEGTYAYFATINDGSVDSSGSFAKYRRPTFPYLIGNNYNDNPIDFNFQSKSNQEDVDINDEKWCRIINPYNLIEDEIQYDYLYLPKNLSQKSTINFTSYGSIDSIGISSAGDFYQIGDSISFEDRSISGNLVSAKVSKISGKPVNDISVSTNSIGNVEVYPSSVRGEYVLYTPNPHEFKNLDIISISGISTTSTKIEGSYKSDIKENVLLIVGLGTNTYGIESSDVTGLVTYFNVSGDLTYPGIRENDIFSIGSERVKVLSIDKELSRIRVLRSIDGTVGTSHPPSEKMLEVSKKIIIKSKSKERYDYRINRELYFDPSESVALGTTSGVGIGTTIFLSNPGIGITNIFIPTKSIYIKNHNLKTGDILTYSPNNGSSIIVAEESDLSSPEPLLDQKKVFVAKINENLIGISTVRVGLNTSGTFVGIAETCRNSRTLYFSGIGTGVYHSFSTNYEVNTAKVSRNIVKVSTAQTHGLMNNHDVFIDVNPSIPTIFYIKYNNYNRRVIINSKEFSSVDIDTVDSSIKIPNHGFNTGEKVIYTSTSSSQGLQNNGIYYIVYVDDDTFKLAFSYEDSKNIIPSTVQIPKNSSGSINPINPQIKAYKNSTIIFDLSDSSLSYSNLSTLYSAFQFNLYSDKNFTNKWDKSEEEKFFNVERIGSVGVTTDAKVILKVTKQVPDTLYYRLDPVFESDIPEEKKGVVMDSEVISGSEIKLVSSQYNGKHTISLKSPTEFTYTIGKTPESVSYASSTSEISYTTTCTDAYGPISEIDIKNSGGNYYSLPSIVTINSSFGTDSVLESSSKTIGKIKDVLINDIGYNFPSDRTLSPFVMMPQIVKIDPLYSIESIGISSVGKGYISSPNLIVIDGRTNTIVSDLDLKYSLGDSEVLIMKNTNGISNLIPIIIPIKNSNGVGISSISYNPSNKDVTVTLKSGFSDTKSFPFKVGDKVLIENVGIGIGSTEKGYNSENYNYHLFTVTSTDENIGGIGTVTYDISEFFEESNDTPGIFDDINSVGRIIPQKHFPTFNVILKNNQYLVGESVRSDSAIGVINGWNSKTGILRISSKENFVVGETIIGATSKTQGIAKDIERPDAYFNLRSTSTVYDGLQSKSGFLNENTQRIQDSDYYQKFSYSLKSRVDYNTWNDPVSILNHCVGYKRFSDYQLESSPDNKTSLVVGLSTDLTPCDTINDLIGIADVNCVYDFDLVKENSLSINSNIISNEVIFANRIITDFSESVGNRVLSVDDVSSTFNSKPRPTTFSIIDNFDVREKRALKYITYVKDRRFTQQRQLMIVDLIHDRSFGYMNQYGRVGTSYDQGFFDFTISGTDGQVQFFPTKFSINDYDIINISYNLDDNLLGTGTTIVGQSVIDTNSAAISYGHSSRIVGIDSAYNSAKVLVQLTADSYQGNEFEFTQLNIVHNGDEVSILEYGQLTTSASPHATSGFGTYFAHLTGSGLIVDFIPNAVGVGSTGVINTITVGLANSTTDQSESVDMKHSRIESRVTSISSSILPEETVISEYPCDGTYDVGYFMIQVHDSTNNEYQFSEFVVVDDYQPTISDYGTYDTEFGEITTSSGLGTIGSRVIKSAVGIAATTQVLFTPLPGIDVNVNVYMNALRNEDDEKDQISFNNGSLETGFGLYEGNEKNIKRSFNLTYKNDSIFEKIFDGNDASIVDIDDDTITIPNHFFVSGESIKYYNTGVGSTESIAISTENFAGIGLTDKLPENLFVVNISDNKIKLASTAQNALKTIPKTLDIVSVGIGTQHRFVSTNQNSKMIVSIDNIIQSPVVSVALTTTLSDSVATTDDLINFTEITSFFGGDLVKIGDEIMLIEGIGIGVTNRLRVRRSWLGTSVSNYPPGELVTKVIGDYNIVDNVLTFIEAPSGNDPLGGETNTPDERDWVGISTGSSFHARVFLRSGIPNTSDETYHKNYVFDDISQDFNGTNNKFTLKSNGSDVNEISNENAIILVNDVFQGPGQSSDYTLSESVGITTLIFTGNPQIITNDVGITSFPKGGVIVSVGSTNGFGYQPLVCAGGTAVVSVEGSIESISIGNSGSGYREGSQIVNVGVKTSNYDLIHIIGSATINDGHISSVLVTNPGIGYVHDNPPIVVFDDPLSYENIPLIFSDSSPSSGIGTGATVNIVVGQKSSVIDFEIKNTGYGYNVGEVLTIPFGGQTGIPTTTEFQEFKLTIDKIFADKFTGWSLGTLEVLDSIERFIDGKRTSFPLSLSGNIVSIIASRGSKINVQDVLLVFVNGILQVPGEGYIFTGGSVLTFTEAIKVGDSVKIIFYKGTGGADVIDREILETLKPGDTLTINNDSSIGQPKFLDEDFRTVNAIESTNLVNTNLYFGPGNTIDENLLRPVVWCRQTEDKIIDGQEIGKDREIYEPIINPITHTIKPVSIGSTILYCDRIRPAFDGKNENDTSLDFQNKVTLISQIETKVETNSVNYYDGDSGIVIGFGTTSIEIGSVQLIFDLHIPIDSPLRDTTLVGTAITLSSLDVGDYFIVNDTNVGHANTTINSLDMSGNVVSIGTSYLDNTYVVQSTELIRRPTEVDAAGVGIGTSLCKRIFVNVDEFNHQYDGIDTSNYFGQFSWGKVVLDGRSKESSYPANTILRRTKQLKYKNYII